MAFTILLNEPDHVQLPERAPTSLAAFRRWAGDNSLPEKTRVDFYKGEVWIDMTREQLFTHGLRKTEIAAVLRTLTRGENLGYYWCNGVLLTNRRAKVSGNPDGTFVSHASLAAGRVKLRRGREEGFVELVGTADMVLEVVSRSSEKKDNQVLMEAYWEAGIPEYWLVDARGDEVEFDVLRRGAKRYTAARKTAGWARSAVFGKAFRLTRSSDSEEQPEFNLEVR